MATSTLFAVLAGTAFAAPLEVKTAQGRVSGIAAADDVRVYRGIPYAAAPVGDLRWRDPQPSASWPGVRDATQFGARCTQTAGNARGPLRGGVSSLPISEDCLYLNVSTAARGNRERRPVIVWIHGGSFMLGTGASYDATALAKHGVVVVTINYRLGALGFFAHPSLSAESVHHTSGNFAFADTIAALDWVRTNIAAFGGDPHKITVAGQSGGGRLIQSLRTSPCARGLFTRAIIESAPIRIQAMRTLADAERDGRETAEKVAAPSLAQLRAIPAEKVLDSFPAGQPVIDGRCITQDPLRALAAGRSHDTDLLVGSNADEGTFPFLRAREYGIAFENAADYSAYVHDRFADDASAFLSLYPVVAADDFNTPHREAFRDETEWLVRFTASAHAKQGRTFAYYFSHRPPAPATGPDRGATHAAEVSYAFNTPAPEWRDEDHRVADVMSAYWANFAARGDPNGPGLPSWPAFIPGKLALRMNLGPMTPKPELDAPRLAIFDALYRRVMD